MRVLAELDKAGVLSPSSSRAVCKVGLETVDDLAFVFTTAAEAEAYGLLECWRWARAGAVADAARSASAVIAAAAGARPIPRRPTPAQAASRLHHFKRRRASSTDAAPSPQEDESARRAAATLLAGVVKSWAPAAGYFSGTASDAISGAEQQFIASIDHLEARSLHARRRAWRSWEGFCRDRNLEPLTSGSTTVIADFVATARGPTGPRGLWDRMQWLARVARAPISMPGPPRRRAVQGVISEPVAAVVIEPEMAVRLDEAVAELEQSEDWRLGAALGALIMTAGCVRWRHLQRARLVGRTELAIRAVAFRGKTRVRGARSQFKFSVPRCGPRGLPTLDILWDKIAKQASEARRPQFGLVRDFNIGEPLSMAQFHSAIRSVAVEFSITSSASLLSSYSFRRFQSTLSDLRGASWEERLAIGDWCDAKAGNSASAPRNMIPITYAGKRNESAEFCKLLQWRFIARAVADHGGRQRADAGSDQPQLMWENIRVMSTTFDWAAAATALATDMAAAAQPEAAIGAEDVVLKEKLRTFVIPPRRVALAATATTAAVAPTRPDEPKGNGNTPSSCIMAGADLLMFVHTLRRGSALHVEAALQPFVPICKEQAARALKQPAERVQGFSGAASAGRILCSDCFKVAPSGMVQQLARLLSL